MLIVLFFKIKALSERYLVKIFISKEGEGAGSRERNGIRRRETVLSDGGGKVNKCWYIYKQVSK